MENLDVMVLRTLRDWRRAGKRALLATVVRTWGSSPRPVGSIMACARTARWSARCRADASRTT
jgi:xanthine dehydrogenase accessory factor